MIRQLASITAILALALAASPPTAAQWDTSEISGEIQDRDGTPMPGVRLTMSPKREPDRIYKGKTNKKGRYFVQGLWTPQEDKQWVLQVEADGYVPVHVRIESRTANRVLLGPVMEQPIKFGGSLPDFPIAKLGKARVDVTLGLEEQVMQEAYAAAAAAGIVGGEQGEADAGQQEPEKDPWIEAAQLANAGDYEGSLLLFQEAIEESPEEVERHETYAKVLAHVGRFDEALAAADQALALDADRLDSRLVQSQVYIKTGELDQARAVLQAAAEISPGDPRVLEQLVYVAQEAGDVEEQIAIYRSITEIQPDNLESWLALGDLYAKTGDLEASAEAFGKVVAIDPDNAYRTYYNIAVLILNKDEATDTDIGRATEALRRAVEINADYAPAWRELGRARLLTGDLAGAVTAFENFLRISPDDKDAAQIRGLVASLKK